MTREECIMLLQKMAELTGRYPKKSDFSETEVMSIKSYFGPWPRALEAAGVKEPPEVSRIDKNRAKRIEKKRAKNVQRKIIKKQNLAEKKGEKEK